MALNIGDPVPNFKATNDQGEVFNSDDVIGKKPVVIYFYPKNFTPGCTTEACSFRDSYEDFLDHGAEVIGISSDHQKSHSRFKKKYNLPFTFLSDQDKKLRKLFGVKNEFLGLLPGRETFVIDQHGLVTLRFNNINGSKHLKKALEAIKNLKQ